MFIIKDSTINVRIENNLKLDAEEMSDTELDAKLQHSYAQSLAGEGLSMDAVFDDLERMNLND